MRFGSATILTAAVVFCGCDSPEKAAESLEAIGSIELSIGNEAAEVPYSGAQCWQEDGRRFKLGGTRSLRTRAATRRIPDVLIGRISPDGSVNATVFDFGSTWYGESYDAITILAERAEGVPHVAACTFDTVKGLHRLVCRRATPMPWQSPGGPPPATFEVDFECDFEAPPSGD